MQEQFLVQRLLTCRSGGFRLALKAQNISYKTLPFKAPLAPWLPLAGIIFIFFILGCEFYLSISPFGEKGSAKVRPDVVVMD